MATKKNFNRRYKKPETKKEVVKVLKKQGATFFLDTNVYGKNADSVFSFADKPGNKVIVTDVNFEELDKHKKKMNSFGKNCRISSANFLKLSIRSKQGLIKGCRTREGGEVYLFSNYKHDKRMIKNFCADIGENDLRLICATMQYSKEFPQENVKLVSMDRNIVTLARENGLNAEYKRGEQVDPRDLYCGFRIIKIDENDSLYSSIMGSANSYNNTFLDVKKFGDKRLENLVTNEYVVFADDDLARQIRVSGKKPRREQVYRFDKKEGLLKPIKYNYNPIISYSPLNFEQVLAFDMLLDNNIKINSLVGEAGSGKTFIALLIALYKTINKRKELRGEDKKIMPSIKITKRMKKVQGEDYGWLPGDKIEKNETNYRGIINNYTKIGTLNTEAYNYFEKNTIPRKFDQVIRQPDHPLIEIVPLGDIRGDSLDDNEILIIDETQNMESSAVRTLVTRIGEGEVYLTGDVTQTDNPNTFEYDGLTHIINSIQNTKDPRYFGLLGSVTLRQNERSAASAWASKYL